MLRAIFKPRFGAWSAADVAALPLALGICLAFGLPLYALPAFAAALFLVAVIGGMQVEEPTDLWRDK
jgi:hypothetical protein